MQRPALPGLLCNSTGITEVQTMNRLLLAILLLLPLSVMGTEKANIVMVVKSKQKLYLKNGSKTLKTFDVVLGANPIGPKEKKGDRKTPEGKYVLDYKNSKSDYYKSIHISYPNAQDMRAARKKGVNPGGQIMIHGQSSDARSISPFQQQFDKTYGCIAVTNGAMDEIWNAVDAGTPIVILP
jgi:murein L,D-transpeptidase YafK